ncbi:bifunctional UDP-N-acetylglucosamine diphosphorylase/glucosamine-1-phosphate N-acetyltransferase GlmU [Candidatus Palibaumannia cicadellinicola]|uniref:Bifunctional protein GlmU n=1 Tax=Baumannia cicadellinicola subsp. Homalodisca coagulata TaxID=374463 RepID=GLMU_BAUCH|nr:bifunctional UDP-N-acetylglucosamine diphosphorylase/glucosamine-1-phosphate N-acetyltransferase GlmU [Candidatus Baumannia cicadellinicola]Q1LTV6.1 RecName: Full=Bifunctional protein GlmU; Includes: RecName: Full=UDP-N-acetylglucosamine pyrophosphorylase; AltName: Full=N-acetylglucosamine-1-phosphate uridyltransferase; Includes: RecName: Full=Glucosamine-1-phosphate N-acetyltransferase [Baumannia cicadellinicola str. Hc (Homalodisca coagulata)]ABF13975.1 UDP-N-acetylglucosamine pyrophosphoryl
MLNIKLNIVILAAGKSTRMNSDIPKVLHLLAGKPILQYVIDTAIKLKAKCKSTNIYIVYGYKGELLQQKLAHKQKTFLHWIKQVEQSGTGHAVQQVLPFLGKDEEVLILYGDVPLISFQTLIHLLTTRSKQGLSLLTANLTNPDGYGRILYKEQEVVGIIEHQEANAQQKLISEINTGILAVSSNELKIWITKLTNNNSMNEFYLTDIIALAWQEGKKIHTIHPEKISEINGINDCAQLANLERLYQKEQAESLLRIGVIIADPNRFDLRGELKHGDNIFFDTNVLIEGQVSLGNQVTIGTGCIIKNTVIGDNVIIKPYSIIEEAHLANGSIVGPFAHLRPGSKIEENAYVGNFVEIKKSTLGKKSKVAHLSYIGDANIGKDVNIGAGTITCNYDGANKHQTIIGDNVFIGSDSQLIAPLTIGDGATIGAGTTVTSNVTSNEVIISRIRQFPIINWQRPKKKIRYNIIY